MLCDDLEGWDDGVRGGSKTEGICDIVIHISLIHFVGQQKRIRCKATISNKKKAGACLYTHTHTHTQVICFHVTQNLVGGDVQLKP